MAAARPKAGRDGVAALGKAEMADLMAPFAPFESRPRLAVAVSGGADSLALALLLKDWASARGGQVTALIVDHGLRENSAQEARQVRRYLRDAGLSSIILAWQAPKPHSNIQAEARRARYDLMTAWCARQGVLHLALAHHRDDQAETLLLRLGRGSGLDGLAAMAPTTEHRDLRIIRPLLGVSKTHLVRTLQARGQVWVEDPSNQNTAHGRVRARALLSGPAGSDLPASRLAAAAGHLGRARQALGAGLNRFLATEVALFPAGYAELDLSRLAGLPDELRLRALSRLLMTVGGQAYGPRFERLQRLMERLEAPKFRGATLGGCRLLMTGERLLIVRECGKALPMAVKPGEFMVWDSRFEVAVELEKARKTKLWIASLGVKGSAQLRARAGARPTLPGAVRTALPALFDRHGPREVPHLGYLRRPERGQALAKCRFSPKNSLTIVGFTVA